MRGVAAAEWRARGGGAPMLRRGVFFGRRGPDLMHISSGHASGLYDWMDPIFLSLWSCGVEGGHGGAVRLFF